jgi:hypothetical protein
MEVEVVLAQIRDGGDPEAAASDTTELEPV